MAMTQVPSGSPQAKKKWSDKPMQDKAKPPLFNPLHRPKK